MIQGGRSAGDGFTALCAELLEALSDLLEGFLWGSDGVRRPAVEKPCDLQMMFFVFRGDEAGFFFLGELLFQGSRLLLPQFPGGTAGG